jgi:formamidopyrimidine-DNA glycosylase
VAGREALAEHDRGGLEVLDATFEAFDHALRQESHTLKRTLTDPRLFSGIGNAYSDEILHAARLSPFKGSTSLTDEESRRLFDATRRVLQHWTTRLQEESGERFPEKVTAFREGMAVHGRYGEPCPDCGSPVQRIVYAANEANYCATCQTGGRPLADRALSRLLREDWVAFAAARLRRAKTGDAATEHLPRPKAGDAATARLRRDEPGDASRPAAKPGRRAARSRRAKPPRDE